MGYHTEFSGKFNLNHNLTVRHYNELKRFVTERHDAYDNFTPSIWCGWTPSEDGDSIVWNGGEKFYNYVEWIDYLIANYFEPWGYVLNGKVNFRGENFDDVGSIFVVNNKTNVKKVEC
jgi:hypothetical protein